MINNSENEIENTNDNEVIENYGIEILSNVYSLSELTEMGFEKIPSEAMGYLDSLFQVVPQLIVHNVNTKNAEQAVGQAIENSYRCILDPSKHLATIKGTTDVYIGGALDNATNQVAGQARWLKNDAVFSVSNAPQLTLNVFNALSLATGQYFMSQINSNLSEIKNGIGDVKQYIDAIKQSELETAFQDLYEILEHIQYIKGNPERTHETIIQIDETRKIAKNGINLYKKQIEKVIKDSKKTDNEDDIRKNTEELRKNMVQYRYAVYTYNLAQILKIYLRGIDNVKELNLFRSEISNIVKQYKVLFKDSAEWINRYLNESEMLNKASKAQILLSIGSGIFVGALGIKTNNYKLAGQTSSLVSDLFEDNRKKKKKLYVQSDKEYQVQMRDMELIDSSVATIDKYIAMKDKKMEILYIDGEGYMKNVDE